ncbi:SMI1/KNR4 family protein [Salmonella enterica subsp. enterica serovar Oranienburg]|nr:SMI1/KNR4 family protein [Salmonella enterica subsp. enterica serovar Oranienburg]
MFSQFELIDDLKNLLSYKNGFYGFESALHVLPFETTEDNIGLLDWNKKDLWIGSYKSFSLDGVFFAEDIFGGQFYLSYDGVYTFDPETGGSEKLSSNINGWCEVILNNYDFLTGYTLAHSWQKKYGKIPNGYRLIPKIPFIFGGEFDLDNLYIEKSYIAMRNRANIAIQIRNIQDGDSIKLKFS